MIAIFMSFAGQFAFFTYIRPVYMNLAGFGVDGLTPGAAEFWYRQLCRDIAFVVYSQTFGETGLSGRTVCARPERAGTDAVGEAIKLLLLVWRLSGGLTFALIPVGWSTWITRSLTDQAEKAGSIQVVVIQLANTCGAAIGGYALDNIGLTSPLMLSGTLMLLTALLVTAKVKMKKS